MSVSVQTAMIVIKNTGLRKCSDNDDSGIYWQGWKHGVQEREKISDPYGLQV